MTPALQSHATVDKPDVQQLRSDTPGCAFRTHLNNAGASLAPRPVLEAVQAHIELEAQIGGYEAADLKNAETAGFYASMGRLLNTQADNIAFAGSATEAYARVLHSIPWQSGDVLLTTNNDYVSNQIAFLAIQKRFGVRMLRGRDDASGAVDPEDMERLIRREKPRLVAVTHVPTNSGLIQPVEAVGRACRQTDTLYLVDACQSAGQMPLDVEQIGCDFLSGTMRKYLRGPRGAGFLYVSNRVLNSPIEMLAPDMRSAEWIDADNYETAKTARRFEFWEMPVALLLGSKAATDYTLHLGAEWIAERVQSIAANTREILGALPGIRVLDRGDRKCGIVTVYAAHWDQQKLLEKLSVENINCRISTLAVAQIDFRQKEVGWALRVSPHYFNTEDEIRHLADRLQRAFPL